MKQRNCENRTAFELAGKIVKVPRLGTFIDGIKDNSREAELSDELSDVVLPVRFSVLGLVNIQDSAPKAKFPKSDFGVIMGHHITDADTVEVLEHSGEFAVVDDEMKIVDFGESGISSRLVYWNEKVKAALSELSQKIKRVQSGKGINIPS